MDTAIRLQVALSWVGRVACLLTFSVAPIYAEHGLLPEWRSEPAFSQTIGNPSNGITGQYILSVGPDGIGGVMYAREHWKLKPSDPGLPLSAFKKREDRWDRLYMSRVRFVLDQSEVIEFEVPPALSPSVSLMFPYPPTELLTEAVLSNGITMNGGVRITENKKPVQRYDARREKRDLKFLPDSNFDLSPRNKAVIKFRNHYGGEGTQYYNCRCVSSLDAGPITHAKLHLSGDPGDPEKESVDGRVSFSQPVYEVDVTFKATRPYGTNHKIGGNREAAFECITTLGKVIRTLHLVAVSPVRN